MTNDRTRSKAGINQSIIITLVLAFLGSIATPFVQAQNTGPLILAKSSYFFVGGRVDTSVEGSPMVGHMYVEYMIPQRQQSRYRLL